MLGEADHHRGAARLEGLQLAVLPDAAALLLDQLADRRAVLHLVVARPIDVPTHAPKPGALSGRRAHRRKPVGAVVHNVRQVADRLDIVHDRWLAVEDPAWRA